MAASLKTDSQFTHRSNRSVSHGLVMHFVFYETDVKDWTKNGFYMPAVKM